MRRRKRTSEATRVGRGVRQRGRLATSRIDPGIPAEPAGRDSRDSRTTASSPEVIRARILEAVRSIPRGRVCTYGNVADVAGLPRRARLVGTVLTQTPAARGLPWYRVINAGGRISFPAGSDAYVRQRRKLEAEGIVFVGGRIDLRHYGWPAPAERLDELLWKPG